MSTPTSPSASASRPGPSRGAGPGEITADGCAVDLYARLPQRGEAPLIHAAVAPGTDILDLGCGTGRVAGPLVALGHRVVGVDTSPGMLEYAQAVGVEAVRAAIEDVRLTQASFGAVLLASHLINTSDAGQRDAFLATARHHLAPDGALVIQRHRPGWIAEVRDSEGMIEGIRTQLRVLARTAPDLLTARITYGAGDATWTQEFTARELDDAALTAVLDEAGLHLVRFLTEDGEWALATHSL
jgi:SAM-dependent methyltransferase